MPKKKKSDSKHCNITKSRFHSDRKQKKLQATVGRNKPNGVQIWKVLVILTSGNYQNKYRSTGCAINLVD